MMDYFEVLKLLSRLNGQDNPQAKDLFDYYLKLKIIYDGIFMD